MEREKYLHLDDVHYAYQFLHIDYDLPVMFDKALTANGLISHRAAKLPVEWNEIKKSNYAVVRVFRWLSNHNPNNDYMNAHFMFMIDALMNAKGKFIRGRYEEG